MSPLLAGTPSIGEWFPVKIFRVLFLTAACCALSLSSARAEATWLTDFHRAQEEAKAGHKLLLLNFTGSDWCGWCMRLQAEVFSKPEFAEYARQNLVLVELDFPRAKALSSEVRSQNAALAEKYGIEGLPDDCGSERGRQAGRPARLRARRTERFYRGAKKTAQRLD